MCLNQRKDVMEAKTIIKALANLIQTNGDELPATCTIKKGSKTFTEAELTAIRLDTENLLFLDNHAPTAIDFADVTEIST